MILAASKRLKNQFSIEHLFMISVLLVNGGNYLYNLVLGRILGPEKFADAAILITFLLVFSFIAMTFQIVTTKFTALFDDTVIGRFVTTILKYAVITGIIFGALIVVFSNQLQAFFNTSSSSMFVVFGIGIPLYFMMSVNRGWFQGKQKLVSLSITYQAEMVSRLIFTLALIYLLNIDSSIIIAIGIFISFVFGLIPFKTTPSKLKSKGLLSFKQTKMVKHFFIITIFYELTQIIINNSDILLVKHYFESYDAGLYASLALIGRVVYFIAWMFVMLLLPKVVQMKKEGKPTTQILLKYVLYISVISSTIILACISFPETIIQVLFGKDYISISPLLWKYALATGIFAVSNIFAYYYLSLDKYMPVVLSGLFGSLQVILVVFYHESIAQVVHVQILAMSLLLIMQLLFFLALERLPVK